MAAAVEVELSFQGLDREPFSCVQHDLFRYSCLMYSSFFGSYSSHRKGLLRVIDVSLL